MGNIKRWGIFKYHRKVDGGGSISSNSLLHSSLLTLAVENYTRQVVVYLLPLLGFNTTLKTY